MNQMNQMDQKPKTDEQFFETLKIYTPILYSGDGEPIFMLNHKWQSSCFCVLSSCLAYGFCIWFFFCANYLKRQEQENSPTKNFILFVINCFMLTGLVTTFIITQFVNPGIRNPDSITEQEFEEIRKKYCYYCEKDVLQTMSHCKECEVCIEKKDHHCMFFQKCMGGTVQQNGFKFFLLFACTSCITLFTTLILYLS